MGDQAFDGTVTLLFTDVEDSTAISSRSGDAAARAVLRDCEELMRTQIAEHGGREVKSLGDGLMIAFSSATRAIRCAVGIQKALSVAGRSSGNGLRVRMGLNAGEAIHEGDDLFGTAVNAAARIAARASGGEIIVSEVVKILAGNVRDVEFVDKGRVKLKGLEDRYRLFAVTWKEDLVTMRPFERTPFVGRDAERAELCSFLDGLVQGRGGVVVVGGEPGVGKTRLTDEVGAEATRREHRVLVGHCYESGAPPYIPFVEIIEAAMREVDPETLRVALGDAAGEVAKIVPQLRAMYDDIPPPLELPAEQERRYVFNSLWEFIERASSVRPIVLILDDVHWADESTLLAAEHIAQRLKDIPVLVLATYRDSELEISRPLARTLESLLRNHRAHRVSLRRLPEEGVRSMLRALSDQEPPEALVRAIYAETDGNPFFAEEVFKHLSEEGRLFDDQGRWRTDLEIRELDVPEGVKLVIGRRLERLTEPTRVALSIAAIIGRRFEYRVLEAVGEVDTDLLLDAMDEAENAQLIVSHTASSESIFSFAHELIRQTLLTTTSLPRRQRRHLNVARVLQEVYDDLDARAADIAGHLLLAGSGAEASETARFLRQAGRRALDAAAFEQALRHYEDALALPLDVHGPEHARLLFEHGLALRTRGRFEEAFAAWRRAIDVFEAAGDRAAAGETCREIAVQLGWIGRGTEGLEWAARGLAITEGMTTSDRADLLAIAGASMSWLGQHDEGLRLIDEGIALAEELGDRHALGRALGALSLHHYMYMECFEMIEVGYKAAALLKEAGALWDSASFVPLMLFAHNLVGQFDESEALLEEIAPVAERIGHQVGSMLIARGAEWGARASDLERFGQAARADIVANRDNNLGWISNGHTWLGVALTWKGEWEDALENHRTGLELENPGAFHGWAAAMLIVHLARLGREDELMALYEQKRDVLPAEASRATIGAVSLLSGVLEAAWLTGRHEIAASSYGAMEELIAHGVLFRVFDFRSTQLLAALAAQAAGDFERSDKHLDAASIDARSAPLPIEEADICLYRAKCLVDRGEARDSDTVRSLVADATESFNGLGMQRYLELMKKRMGLP